MSKEFEQDKDLLLKDLCARLPYYTELYSNVADGNWAILTPVVISNLMNATEDLILKLYLRPMSSMTEEEKKQLKAEICPEGTGSFNKEGLILPGTHYGDLIHYDFMESILSWLRTRHFDYNNLIEKGLALEAPAGMYKEE